MNFLCELSIWILQINFSNQNNKAYAKITELFFFFEIKYLVLLCLVKYVNINILLS